MGAHSFSVLTRTENVPETGVVSGGESSTRTHKIAVRLNDSEFDLVSNSARERGAHTLARFARGVLLAGVQEHGGGVESVPGVERIEAQLARIGNNLNQIARALNARQRSDLSGLVSEVDALRAVRQELSVLIAERS